jgi:hypothetical protein
LNVPSRQSCLYIAMHIKFQKQSFYNCISLELEIEQFRAASTTLV